MSPLLAEVNRRWQRMFSVLAGGGDVPPGHRLRTEGLMEALILLGEVTAGMLQEQMDRVYCEVYGENLAGKFGEDWRTFFPFPQIPAMGIRAPVYPSTSTQTPID
jgi:hypothetical protein